MTLLRAFRHKAASADPVGEPTAEGDSSTETDPYAVSANSHTDAAHDVDPTNRSASPDDPDGWTEVDAGVAEPPAAPARFGWLKGRSKTPGVGEVVTSVTTRIVAFVLVCGCLAGPAALIWAAVGRSPQAVVQAAASDDQRAPQRAAASAQSLVRVWLSSGTEDADQLASMVQVPPADIRLPKEPPTPPAWVDIASIDPSGQGEWRITITAGGGLAGEASAYAVLVTATPDGASPVSLPAQVPMPPRGDRPEITEAVSQAASLPVTGNLSDTVAGFLSAMLTSTSTEQLARWTSPQSTIVGVGVICSKAQLQQILGPQDPPENPADGVEISVLASVSCTQKAGSVQSQQYPLILRGRAGRWEVDRYSSTPPGTNPSTASAGGGVGGQTPASRATTSSAHSASPTPR